MRLTRRDALAALAAAGVTVGGGVVLTEAAADGEVAGVDVPFGSGGDGPDDDESGDGAAPTLDDAALATLTAVAAVVYPSEVEGIDGFVETYVDGRLLDDPDREAGLARALADLDDVARDWTDERFVDLDADRRDSLLSALAVDTTEPDPDGRIEERIRYYVVNDLLYALYASPAGGELVGTPNPVGHPGGYRTALSPDERRSDPAETRDPTATLERADGSVPRFADEDDDAWGGEGD